MAWHLVERTAGRTAGSTQTANSDATQSTVTETQGRTRHRGTRASRFLRVAAVQWTSANRNRLVNFHNVNNMLGSMSHMWCHHTWCPSLQSERLLCGTCCRDFCWSVSTSPTSTQSQTPFGDKSKSGGEEILDSRSQRALTYKQGCRHCLALGQLVRKPP